MAAPSAAGQAAPAALDLAEEAVHLLRGAGSRALGCYYLGAFPFALIFFAFFCDLSHGAFGYRHLAAGSLALALGFVWMKFWQMRFMRRLRAVREGAPLTPSSPAELGRAVLQQAALQPTGLFLLPIAFVTTFPFAWVYAFYQNVTLYGDGSELTLAAVVCRAQSEARRWPGPNHALLGVLFLFGLAVYLNVMAGLAILPHLAAAVLGVDSPFSRSGLYLLNSTFFMLTALLTYLALDPLCKAAWLLRCFYGESIVSGRDLRASLRRLAAAPLLLLALAGPPPAAAATDSEPLAVSPAALSRALDEVLASPAYTWKQPRGTPPPQDLNWFERMVHDFLELLGRTTGWFWDRLLEFLDWLSRLVPRPELPDAPQLPGFSPQLAWYLVFGLLGAGLIVAAFFLHRSWKRSRGVTPLSSAAPTPPDLNAETLTADALPAEEWLTLARELAVRGEFRLALRAYYLAQLAQLAHRRLLTIQRAKSNRDYRQELRRRAHALPDLPPAFETTMNDFERVWYGTHPADEALVARFIATQRVFWADAI